MIEAVPALTGRPRKMAEHPPVLNAGVKTWRTASRDIFLAELCNGSTYDSDSYSLGSNPSSAAKTESTP